MDLGSPGWRFKYRFQNREKMISLGTYPEVPLKLTRERRESARGLVAAGVDPSAERKAKRAAREDTLQSIAVEWLPMLQKSLAAKTFKKKKERLTTFVFPYLGKTPGDLSTEFALRLLPLTFVRPGEMRLAEWIEFDLEGGRIPFAHEDARAACRATLHAGCRPPSRSPPGNGREPPAFPLDPF